MAKPKTCPNTFQSFARYQPVVSTILFGKLEKHLPKYRLEIWMLETNSLPWGQFLESSPSFLFALELGEKHHVAPVLELLDGRRNVLSIDLGEKRNNHLKSWWKIRTNDHWTGDSEGSKEFPNINQYHVFGQEFKFYPFGVKSWEASPLWPVFEVSINQNYRKNIRVAVGWPLGGVPLK